MQISEKYPHTALQTEEEIADLEEEIRRLNDAIRAKINPMKLAQTRLENRTYRPNVELCRDNVQYGLCDEVKQIEASKLSLEEKLKQSQCVQIHFGPVHTGCMQRCSQMAHASTIKGFGSKFTRTSVFVSCVN